MAMTLNGQPGGGRGKGRRGPRFRPRAEINVTPFVDVMLVLLIVFMVTAPLLTVGELVDLPNTESKALPADQEPLAVVVKADGSVLLQETELPLEELAAKLRAVVAAGQRGFDERIYVYGDEAADYGAVLRVMAELTGTGFTKVALVTDPLTQ
ncbi:MAG: ExbD/TolR family protein [Caulobacterales bacterium]|nr:ExbD/TolR family protein [Caulobacterales bacterium]